MTKSVITFICIVIMVITLHAFRAMNQPPASKNLIKAAPAEKEVRFAVDPETWNWKVFIEENVPYQNVQGFGMKERKKPEFGAMVLQ